MEFHSACNDRKLSFTQHVSFVEDKAHLHTKHYTVIILIN